MEQFLVQLVVIAVFVGVGVLILQWMGWNIPPIVWRIAGIIIGGIIIVFLIRLLWPLLIGGGPSLSLR